MFKKNRHVNYRDEKKKILEINGLNPSKRAKVGSSDDKTND